MDQPLRTPQRRARPTLVVGLGNPLLGDDGVGWRIAEQVRAALRDTDEAVDVDCLSVGGLRLMERLTGYERVILIDAITTGQAIIGSLSQFGLSDLSDRAVGHSGSAHDATLQTALRLGRALGVELPETIIVIGVEAEITFDFTEALSPAIAAAVPRAVQIVLDLVCQPFQAGQQT